MYERANSSTMDAKTRAICIWLATNTGLALVATCLSMLTCWWVVGRMGFSGMVDIDSPLFRMWYLLTLPIILVLPACLAAATKKWAPAMLTLPYVLLFCWVTLSALISNALGSALWASRVNTAAVITGVVPCLIISILWKIDAVKERRACLAIFVLHIAILVGAVYFYTYRYGVWHLKEPVIIVRSIRFGAPFLSFPLVEEQAAFIVDRKGRLYRIKLATGRAYQIARVPRPEPAKIGRPELSLSRLPGRENPFLQESYLARVSCNELYFRYRYAGEFTLHARIREDTGVVSWELKPTEMPEHLWRVGDRTTASGEAIFHVDKVSEYSPFSVAITGDDVLTVIDPIGEVVWKKAQHGWILVGTSRGQVLVVSHRDHR